MLRQVGGSTAPNYGTLGSERCEVQRCRSAKLSECWLTMVTAGAGGNSRESAVDRAVAASSREADREPQGKAGGKKKCAPKPAPE